MDKQQVLDLVDLLWFSQNIFCPSPRPEASSIKTQHPTTAELMAAPLHSLSTTDSEMGSSPPSRPSLRIFESEIICKGKGVAGGHEEDRKKNHKKFSEAGHEIEYISLESQTKPKISLLHRRSLSDQSLEKPTSNGVFAPPNLEVRVPLSSVPLSTKDVISQETRKPMLKSGFSSPKSVLQGPKLKTIYSGKEVEGRVTKERTEVPPKPSRLGRPEIHRQMNTQGKKSLSKSLSELEFEELKGFIDLGFTFEESELSPRLKSIIPGLQRMVKTKEKENEKQEEDNKNISRPYLSEAWLVRKPESKLIQWKIPELSQGMDMKEHLKLWAHNVASTVR
ncbi:hypothetical protein AMTRI_Chr01g110170 [Amborella trichopoda]|uniref:Uncharacterized protein n=1 Tax=Amborella trichopoda TaxID=13333 RepID=W1NRH7_AMBTC|nr:uncharacterized protein LOC18425607 [Amborella trichopoda]ERM97630.1 hypothetical protein AMTR_s00130p00028330 [Amborella trichopoda]|eukprot:XP_006830214.1 uncharacterized protein LOC18425607 [Amborella trichopoda]